jgi:hypothetical protein
VTANAIATPLRQQHVEHHLAALDRGAQVASAAADARAHDVAHQRDRLAVGEDRRA